MKLMKYISFVIVLSFLLIGCGKGTKEGAHDYRILVIHSNDSIGEDGAPYQKYMAEKFEDEGIDAEIRHFYADFIHTTPQLLATEGLPYLERWKKYNPNLVIIDGDEILNFLTSDVRHISPELESLKSSLFKKQPIVFGGVNYLDRNGASRFTNMTGFVDEIDLKRNLEIVNKITGCHNVLIELDHFESDSMMQRDLRRQIQDSRFVDNSDFHVHNLDAESLAKDYPDKIVVSFISSAEPETNTYYDENDSSMMSLGRDNALLRGLLHTLRGNWLLQVKNDIFSSSFLRHTEHPQFTAIRSRFNNPEEVRLLGGYFSLMETQVDDVVGYAAQILHGTSPQSLPVKIHHADYYMDYNAMSKWTVSPMDYDDYKDEFTIINAPFKVRHPILFWLLVAVQVLLVLGVIGYLGYYVLNYKSKNERMMTTIMRREKIRRLMLIKSQNLIYWFIDDDYIRLQKGFSDKYGLPQEMPLADFGKMVMQDSLYSWKLITEYGDETGSNKVRIHLQLTPEEAHWIEFRFNSTHESSRKRKLNGTAVICDEEVEEEENIDRLNTIANESVLRQSFLSNMSQSLRNPLNGVLGFSQLIAANDMHFSKAELKEFNQQLKDNAAEIIKAIDDTLQESRLEVGEVQLRPIATPARDFMKSIYQSSQLIMPSHLQLRLMCDAEDAFVMMSPAYTRTVFNAFISNAIKYTVTGYIEIGYTVLPGVDQVKFYCKDTGIGLSEENLQHVFDSNFKVFDYDKGAGQGLSIAKTIIEKEDGTIGAESQEGVGSTFWFTLKKVDANIVEQLDEQAKMQV